MGTQRGWTLDALNIVRRLVESRRRGDESLNKKSPSQPENLRLLTSSPTTEFTNEDVYAFARELEKLHPDNRHVKDKIRQQLQVFPPSSDFGATSRDTGFLVDSLAPARSALAGLWLRPNSFRRFPNGSSHVSSGVWRPAFI